MTSLSDLCCFLFFFFLLSYPTPCNNLASLSRFVVPTISQRLTSPSSYRNSHCSLWSSDVFLYVSLCPAQIPLWRYPKFHRAPNQPSTLSSCPERRRYYIFSKTGDIASLKKRNRCKTGKICSPFPAKGLTKTRQKAALGRI